MAEFPTVEGIAVSQKAVAKFVKGLDAKQLEALQALFLVGRENAGWKQFGRQILAASK